MNPAQATSSGETQERQSVSETHTSSHDDAHKTPGHWLLARLGKRVLHPGGFERTRLMLERLDIQSRDQVVDLVA